MIHYSLNNNLNNVWGRENLEKSMESSPKITIWNKNFICVVLTNFLLCMAHFAVNPLVASYAIHLGAAQIMGLLSGMFFGVSLAVRPISGPMITKVDKRTLLIVIFALGGVANLGYALFQSVGMFVFFRFLSGVQYSFVGSLIMTLASDNLPSEKIASGMGIYGVGGAIGTAVAPFIGSQLLNLGTTLKDADFGFALAFGYGAIILFIAIIPSVILAPDKKTKQEVASTGAWYKNIITVQALPSTIIIFFVIMAYALFNAFIIEYGKARGFGANTSYFFMVMSVVLMASRPLSGWLTDRYGIPKILVPGMVVLGIAFILVARATTLPLLLGAGVVAAIGHGATQPALQAMCVQSVPPLKRGVASNTIYVGMDLGFFLGPTIGGIIYNYTNYSSVFYFGAVSCAVGFLCCFAVLPVYKRQLREFTRLQEEQSR